MTPELWRKVSEAFERAASMPPEQQVAFLNNLRSRDAEVAEEVSSLLHEEQQSGSDNHLSALPSLLRDQFGTSEKSADSSITVICSSCGKKLRVSRPPEKAFRCPGCRRRHDEELLRPVLGLLPSDQHRQILLWKIEKLTNAEIAQRIGRCISRVEWKLSQIREILRQENIDFDMALLDGE